MTDEQFAQIVGLLTEIRDALTVPPEPLCEHPEEHRTNLGTMKHQEWKCRDCGLHVRDGQIIEP